MSNQQCKYCPPDGECVCPPEWCHCDPDGIAICVGHVKEREAQLRKELKAANKGAQTNALVNQSLSKQLWELREKLAAVRGIFLEWTDADSIGEWCHDCETEGFIGKLQHSQSCRVGRAIAIIDGKEANDES